MTGNASPPAAAPDASPTAALAPAIRRAVFPAADAAPEPAARLPDPAAFLRALAAELARFVALPVTAGYGHSSAAAGSSDTAAAAPDGFARADGLALAIFWPETLAPAVIAHRFGGGFTPAAPADAAPSVAAATASAAPSVARLNAGLDAAVLRAADLAWPGDGGWSPVAAVSGMVAFPVALEIEGHAFDLGLALRVPAAAPARPSALATAAWCSALRAGLDAAPFDVRAVLHARPLRLQEALALAVGDVLPIATPRDVALRIGSCALARGTITPDPGGGHRVTVTGDGSNPAGTAAITPAALAAPYEDQP